MSRPTPETPYQARILSHSRSPHHWGAQPNVPNRQGFNPLCGDEVTVFWGGAPQTVTASFESRGCALCRASASILMTSVAGQTPAAAAALIEAFTGSFEHGRPVQPGAGARSSTPMPSESDDLLALRDMRRYASRVQCVLLPWTTLAELLALPPAEEKT